MRRVYGLVLAALPLILLNTGCTPRSAAAAGQEPVPVRVYRAQAVSFAGEQRYAATTEPMAQLDLAFRASGAVSSLYLLNGRPLEPGDAVPAGAVLAQLRATEYEARVHTAEAQLADVEAARASAAAQVREAQAGLAQAEADRGRAEALYRGDAVTRAELDAVRARAESARARLAAASANVEGFEAKIRAAQAQKDESRVPLNDTTLVAPFPAVVVARRVECGSSVTPGSVAYTLADLRQVKVSFGVPDIALRQFPIGAPVLVSVDALPGTHYSGRVIGVVPAADPVTRLFRVQVLVANSAGLLKAGMVASVARDTPVEQPMLAVPLRAIRRFGEGERFAVLTAEGGALQSRAVTLGPAQGDLIGISAGLKPGELVVEDAGMRLNAGDHIRIVP